MIRNNKINKEKFLEEMYNDAYFPNFLVEKGKNILVDLCKKIEKKNPENLEELYKLTHHATDLFNDLDEELQENDSEIETVARDCIGVEIENIAIAYGFEEADTEELIATRDW